MWRKEGTALIAVLLVAVSLAGCKTDDDPSTSATGSVPTATYLSGSSPTASSARASDGITPSFDSATQKANNGISPRQEAGLVRDPDARRVADELTVLTKPGHAAYKIGPQDVLEISVFQAPDLSGTVEVDDTGTIDLPLIGETQVSGKTSAEVQRDLSSKLGAKYLQNPQVTVRVKEFNSNRITVSGAVKSPGVFPYKGETLLQYVVKAGGLSEDANSMVLVLRESNGKRSAAKFNIDDIEKGRAPDPTMESGDVIVADTSALKRGYKNLMKVLPLAGFAALL
jgi:polysaccharide export outer membrane protein